MEQQCDPQKPLKRKGNVSKHIKARIQARDERVALFKQRLTENPAMDFHSFGEETGVVREVITTDFGKLVKEKFKPALERIKSVKDRAKETTARRKLLRQYIIKFPKASYSDIAADLNIPVEIVKNDIKAAGVRLGYKPTGEVDTNSEFNLPVKLSMGQRKEKILGIITKRPNSMVHEIAKALNCSESAIKKDMIDMTRDIAENNKAMWQIQFQSMVARLFGRLEVCDDKLSQCQVPTIGARWMEEGNKIIDKINRMYGFYTPETVVSVGVKITKDEEDKITERTIEATILERQLADTINKKLLGYHNDEQSEEDEDYQDGDGDENDDTIDVDFYEKGTSDLE